MSSGRRTFWNALVWALIPFTLGAGLPQLQRRCAAAKGERWSECCFQKTGDSTPVDSNCEVPCCQRRLAKLKGESSPSKKISAGHQTCQSLVNPLTGNCCDLKSSDAPTLSSQIDLPAIDVSFIGLPILECRNASNSWRQDVLSRVLERPKIDRVDFLGHLLI